MECVCEPFRAELSLSGNEAIMAAREVKDLACRSDLLIVGGGPAGLSAAIAAAGGGLRVTILEREEKLGGWPTKFGCMATDVCNKCSACSVFDARGRVSADPRISVITGVDARDIERLDGGYMVYGASCDDEYEFEAQAVIVATGFQPFDASKRGEFGWGRYPGVLTTVELDQMILQENLPDSWGNDDTKLAFIQCVGSRDLSLCHEYCSVACCMGSLRMARVLKHNFPNVNIKIFYMDFQGIGKFPERFRKDAVCMDKIEFCQAMPSKVFAIGEKLVMRYEDPGTSRVSEEGFDSVILAVGMCPQDDAFDIYPKDTYGFYLAGHSASERLGLFAAGTATGPRSIVASMRDGANVALKAVRYVAGARGGVLGA